MVIRSDWSWLTGCENATSFTIYPIWQANTYTISFNANGGSGAPGNQTKTHGVDMTLSTTKPTRTGYTFLGWAESASATSAAYQPGGKYTRNEAKTLYAVWKANTLSVVYNSNGATLIKSQGNVIDEATLATIPQIINYTDSYPDGLWNGNNANALFLEKTGYSFKSTSWNTKADGTGISLDWNMGFDSGKDLGNALGVDFSSGNKTVTLYAVWVPITTTLYYNANGGDGTMGTTRLVYDEEYTAAKNTFTREGYTFVGWNLRRDADNKWRVYNKGWFTEAELSSNGYSKTVYEDQYSYTFNHYYFEGYEGNSTYTYFAVWEKNNVIPIEVTLNINCAELKVGETFQLEATVSPENATNKSVTWSTSDNKVAVVDKNGLVTAYNAGTATITAKTVDGGKAATCQVSITYTESEITGPVKTVSLNGHTYSLYNGKVAWTTAKSWCEDHGGHLMTITSAEEQNIVSQLNQDELLLFLGGYLDENNDWNWVTGETFQYTDWSRVTEGSSYLGIQPDSSFNGTEYYIGTYPIQWSDYRLFVPAVSGFIMETEPVPDMKAAVIRSATASFEGKIDLNFYLLFSDDVPADEGAYVLFTGGETNRKLLVSDAPVVVKNGETRYLFNYPVVAKEIRDIINLRVYDGNDQIIKLTNLNESNDYTQTGVDYSLFTYCSKMLASDSSSDEMKALAAATIDYGTAAQIYFEYGDYTLQSVSDEVTAILLSDLEQYKAVFTGSLPSGVNKRALSVLLESDNSLRLSFYYDEGIDPSDYSYTIDGQDVEIIDDSGRHYLEISNVFSNHLGNTHILTISDGTDTYTIECSVLTYARSSVSNGDEARQNLGKALYLYYIMAYRLFK